MNMNMYANAYSISFHNNDNKNEENSMLSYVLMFIAELKKWKRHKKDCERTVKRCHKSNFHIKYDQNSEWRWFCSHFVRRRSILTE